MKSLILTLLFIVKFATSQNSSVFLGQWQYFDNSNVYHEIIVEKNFGYIIGDSLDPAKLHIKLDSTTVVWTKLGKWTFMKKERSHIVVELKKEKLKLYKLKYSPNNVKAFYQWTNNPERNGNGYMIFHDDFKKRKAELELKIKNGL